MSELHGYYSESKYNKTKFNYRCCLENNNVIICTNISSDPPSIFLENCPNKDTLYLGVINKYIKTYKEYITMDKN